MQNKINNRLKIGLVFLSLLFTAEAQELIKDRNFNQGIRLLGTVDGYGGGIGNICRSGYSCSPSWRLAEWYSNMSLIGNNGGNSWGNPYKAVTVFNNGFRLAVNGMSEQYTEQHGCPTAQANWPSLLMEQLMNVPLSSIPALNLRLTANLEYFRKVTNKNCYASQMTFYLLIDDISVPGNGPNTGFWFGISIFDNRYTSFTESISERPDGQTGLHIFNAAVPNPITVNSRGKITRNSMTINKDILPDLIRMAKSRGFSRQNLVIRSFNIGWENPSNNIATMKISNISLNTTSVGGGNNAGENKTYLFNSPGNREGWRYNNLTEQFGGPKYGQWYFACNQYDPMLFSPKLSGVNGSTHKKVKIKMANNGNPAAYSYIKIYWKGPHDRHFSEARSTYQRIHNDGGWHTYTLRPNWSGDISQIRIDPIYKGDGHWIGIDEIKITR